MPNENYEILEIIKLAQKQYQTKEQLENWLYELCTIDGETPFELLETRQFDRARFYAICNPSPKIRHRKSPPHPKWANQKELLDEPISIYELIFGLSEPFELSENNEFIISKPLPAVFNRPLPKDWEGRREQNISSFNLSEFLDE